MKPTPTPEMIDAFIIAKESADRRLYGFHNLGRHFILDGTTEVWFTASDDYEVGHAAMMAQLERSRVEAGLSAALSVPAEAVVGEPVAWLAAHKVDPKRLWLATPNEPADRYWSDAFPVYRSAPSAPDGWQPIETAPKDGTVILVWRAHGTRPLMVKWDSQCDAFEDEFHGHHVYHLTHWQTLPAPPALGGKHD